MQHIATLKEGDWVDETFLVSAKQVSAAKNGVMYLSVRLADKTGEIDARLWDSAEEVAGRFERDDFVHIKGMVANYQGTLQIKMKALEKVDDSRADLSNFLQTSSRNADEMVKELRGVAAALMNPYLRRLMSAFLEDSAFMQALRRAPAARTLHHNCIGGLMEHILELIAICRDTAKHFQGIDMDLLMVGAFIHDIGKTRELGVKKSIEYTTEGRLIGHISLGYEILLEKIHSVSGFPEELAMLLKHIMLSHHGEYEFGSPKRPKIQEAIIIHYLDDLSAKISNFQATLKKENIGEGQWSSYSKMHDRYLYRHVVSTSGKTNDVAGEDKQASRRRGKDDRQDIKDVKADESSGNLTLDI